jgi:hypothetical protein
MVECQNQTKESFFKSSFLNFRVLISSGTLCVLHQKKYSKTILNKQSSGTETLTLSSILWNLLFL